MIATFLYRCRRCDIVYFAEPQIGETAADVLLRQVSTHRCEGKTADNHQRFGISDLVGFNDDLSEEGGTLG